MGCSGLYHHIGEDERESLLSTIQRFTAENRKLSYSALSDELHISRKAIRLEITRGRDASCSVDYLAKHYNPVTARKDAEAARAHCIRKGKQDSTLLELIRNGICEDRFSPDQLVHTTLLNAGYSVAVSTIYNWLLGPLSDCRSSMRFKGKRKKNGDLRLTSRFKEAKKLEDRPEGCTDRTEFGHLEADTVVSCKKDDGSSACLFTFVDRKTRYMFAYWAESCTALSYSRILPRLIASFPAGAIKSITADRGSEFSDWKVAEQTYGIPMYFCKPHHPWEKGTNENTNGLIREFFPKGTDFSETCQSEVNRRCLRLLRKRPRRCLGYKSSQEMFKIECARLQ